MRKVYKYTLAIADMQMLRLPVGAEILSVKEQRGKIVLYAMVDTAVSRMEYYTIYIHGTGHVVYAANLRFIDTVKLDGGNLMFHVFIQEAQS